mgnify:CR=1 FL=1
MNKPICMKCLKEYRVASIGRMVVYKTKVLDEPLHNIRAIMADTHRCPGCSHEIITAFAMKPLATNPVDVERWAETAKSAIVVIV